MWNLYRRENPDQARTHSTHHRETINFRKNGLPLMRCAHASSRMLAVVVGV